MQQEGEVDSALGIDRAVRPQCGWHFAALRRIFDHNGPDYQEYARSGIPEVWIVNLAAQEVEIHRSPAGDSYTSRSRASRADVLTIEAIPGVQISVAEIFG